MNDRENALQILSAVLPNNLADRLATLSRDQTAEWDSVAHVNLIAALESQFDLFISTDQAESINTLEDIERLIQEAD